MGESYLEYPLYKRSERDFLTEIFPKMEGSEFFSKKEGLVNIGGCSKKGSITNYYFVLNLSFSMSGFYPFLLF